MGQEKIIEYCLKKRGSYIDFPFGPDVLCVKVRADSKLKGRIFAQFFKLKGESKATFSCSREGGIFYREIYPDKIVRGWHCPPVQQPYFSTVDLDGVVPDDIIKAMIDHAYEAVVAKLPKYIQKEISGAV